MVELRTNETALCAEISEDGTHMSHVVAGKPRYSTAGLLIEPAVLVYDIFCGEPCVGGTT
jgi:hypothetical protein